MSISQSLRFDESMPTGMRETSSKPLRQGGVVDMNTPGKDYDKYISYYEDQLRDNRLYINIIVPDELLYISQSKYKIPYGDTFEFIESMILPFVNMIPLDQEDYGIFAFRKSILFFAIS